MKFMVTFDWAPDFKTLSEGIARFRGVNLAITSEDRPPSGERPPGPTWSVFWPRPLPSSPAQQP